MTQGPSPPPASVSVEEIGRRIRWPALPALLFLGILAGLCVVAFVGIRARPAILTGLPSDPSVGAALAAVHGRVRVATGPLRFHSALLGSNAEDARAVDAWSEPESWSPAPTDAERALLGKAAILLEQAHDRAPREARVMAALAAIELARGALGRATERYREVVDKAPGYGEGRLGLGVTLALTGVRAVETRDQRQMLLEAIAQIAAVRSEDPVAEPALYDRVVLLERVGRHDDAVRFAKEYRARYPGSAWAERVLDVAKEAGPR